MRDEIRIQDGGRLFLLDVILSSPPFPREGYVIERIISMDDEDVLGALRGTKLLARLTARLERLLALRPRGYFPGIVRELRDLSSAYDAGPYRSFVRLAAATLEVLETGRLGAGFSETHVLVRKDHHEAAEPGIVGSAILVCERHGPGVAIVAPWRVEIYFRGLELFLFPVPGGRSVQPTVIHLDDAVLTTEQDEEREAVGVWLLERGWEGLLSSRLEGYAGRKRPYPPVS